ncbi:hypothetical protein BZA05DRAFT_387588 [Tricharina praecox]|uniref:uncharacterized protein n=1 Tax=Tricharina praecox TaxID=43433 RepID=UPI00221E802A|nr:uncharacterized protein BZA05DRAFT_387588 [Tricharina praecox]KAI5857215.1 hypothetical protein BZA05DRAFT_387588 [Tricharina praecox]
MYRYLPYVEYSRWMEEICNAPVTRVLYVCILLLLLCFNFKIISPRQSRQDSGHSESESLPSSMQGAVARNYSATQLHSANLNISTSRRGRWNNHACQNTVHAVATSSTAPQSPDEKGIIRNHPMRNEFSRLLPVYYLANCAAFRLQHTYYGDIMGIAKRNAGGKSQLCNVGGLVSYRKPVLSFVRSFVLFVRSFWGDLQQRKSDG